MRNTLFVTGPIGGCLRVVERPVLAATVFFATTALGIVVIRSTHNPVLNQRERFTLRDASGGVLAQAPAAIYVGGEPIVQALSDGRGRIRVELENPAGELRVEPATGEGSSVTRD